MHLHKTAYTPLCVSMYIPMKKKCQEARSSNGLQVFALNFGTWSDFIYFYKYSVLLLWLAKQWSI